MTNIEIEQSHTFTEKETKEEKTFTSIPFGKYAHIPFEELSKLTEIKNGKVIFLGLNYMKWLNAQDWVKENLKSALKKYV